jgi:hypothetical protein
VNGPFTLSPANRGESSETVMRSSARLPWTVNQVAAPATVRINPATIVTMAAMRAGLVETRVLAVVVISFPFQRWWRLLIGVPNPVGSATFWSAQTVLCS